MPRTSSSGTAAPGRSTGSTTPRRRAAPPTPPAPPGGSGFPRPDGRCTRPGRRAGGPPPGTPSAGGVKRIPPTGRPLYSTGKKVWGLPLGYAIVGLMYDKAQYAALNLKIPQTFAQLLNICKVARANGKAAFSIAGTAFPNVGIWLQMIASSTVYAKD